MEILTASSVDRLIYNCKNNHGYRGAIICKTRARATDIGDTIINLILNQGMACSSRFNRTVISFENGSHIRIITCVESMRGRIFNTIITDFDFADPDFSYALCHCEIPYERNRVTYSFRNSSGITPIGYDCHLFVDDIIEEPPDYGEFQCTTEILNYFKELSMEDK